MDSQGRRTVLVVDDSPTILQVVRSVLTRQGYEVVVAPTGEEGLRLAEERRPDLVLVDIMMPGIDGYTMVTRMQQGRQLPMVVMSSKSQAEIGDLFLGRINGWLEKPFSPVDLVDVVGRALKSSDKRAAGSV